MLIDVEHEDTFTRMYILFDQTAHVVRKYGDTYLRRKAKLSAIKFIVLQALTGHGGTMTPTELAEWTHTERHNITTLVYRMSKEGLISTERNSRDRRSVNVTLTDKGRKVHSQAVPVLRDIVKQVVSSISESDATLLEKPLNVLWQNAHDGLQHLTKHAQPQPK